MLRGYHGKSYQISELIDTLWNVNDCNKNMVLCFLSRINRYIMECKFTLGNG